MTSYQNENIILLVELKKYGSEDRLERDICNSKQWKDFKKANHNLYLFLDGLDEVRFRIDNVSSLLLSILEKAPIERLFLRISCRTAEWPSSFEVNLKDLWKNNQENNVKAFEIAPLRECDVHEAAKMCRKKPLF